MPLIIAKTASGPAHERFGRGAVATVVAHVKLNPRLKEPAKAALALEQDKLGACVARLCEANKPYQAWLHDAMLEVRAGQRVADFLCDEAQRDAVAFARRHPNEIGHALPGGVAALWTEKQPSRTMRLGRAATVDSTRHTARQLRLVGEAVEGAIAVAETLDAAADGLDKLNQEARRIAAERVPLKFAVDKAITELRGELDHMQARLTLAGLSDEFIASLFPELDKNGDDPADEEPADPAPTPA